MGKSITFLFILTVYLLSSCGSESLKIKGDQEAILMAEKMIMALGGKKNWQKSKSLYIRTITRDMRSGDPIVIEEWINLDEPKFMNHRVKNDVHHFQIIDRNDGWSVQNSNVSLLQPSGVTRYLNWFDRFFMRNIKRLALGGDNVEVKINSENAFDMFIDGEFVSGFQLNRDHLPEKYVTPGINKKFTFMTIKEWGEYKGFTYPLKITGEELGSYFQTDYWDIGTVEAEAAFNVSFDPYEIAQNFE
jgi:hypothetical protein